MLHRENSFPKSILNKPPMNSRFTAPGLARATAAAARRTTTSSTSAASSRIGRRQFRAAALCTLAGTRARLRLARRRDAALHRDGHAPRQSARRRRAARGRRRPRRRGRHVRQRDRHPSLREDRRRRLRRHRPRAWLATAPSPVARLKRLVRPGLASPEARRQRLLDQHARPLRGAPPGRRLPPRSRLHLSLARARRRDPDRLPRRLPRRPGREARRAAAAAEVAGLDTRIADLRQRLADTARAAGASAPRTPPA